jgi:hypothetical protein
MEEVPSLPGSYAAQGRHKSETHGREAYWQQEARRAALTGGGGRRAQVVMMRVEETTDDDETRGKMTARLR